jgi:4-amino-4-deoxy-L-arabinose transferase-like glycosyltransferase
VNAQAAAAPVAARRRGRVSGGLAAARARVRALPRALWLCAALAFLNAAAWSMLTPPFQIPDEPVQSGYAQYVAETGKVPRVRGAGFYWAPPRDASVAFSGVPFSILGNPSWSKEHDRAVQNELRKPLGRVAEGGAGYAVNYPPLYYAYEAVPYVVASSGTFYDRLWAMRLGSALLAAFTVAFVYLFMRELLPRVRWAWTVGALAVAFQPVFAFIAGGVQNDNLVWTCSAALLFLMARAFRRGLSPAIGVGVGAAITAGLLTKGTMYGLVPGTAIGLILAARRTPPERRRGAWQGLALAALVAAVPFGAWLVANNVIYDRPANTASSGFRTSVSQFHWRELASYVWQFYLPKLPFMTDQFPVHMVGYKGYPTYPLWQTYIQGFVGRFGWFQYGFPTWANWTALGIYTAVLGLAGTALWRARDAVRRRWPELLTYVLLLGGLMLLVNVSGYQYRLSAFHDNFEQARYLLPMVGLYGAVVALAAVGAGRRFGTAVAALLVVLAVGHNAFAQLLSADRYYLKREQPSVTSGTPPPDTGRIRVQPQK